MKIEKQNITNGSQQFADAIINQNSHPKEEITPEVDIFHLPKPTTKSLPPLDLENQFEALRIT